MDYNSQVHKCKVFLKNHDVGILASSTLDGEPHASLINYLIDDKKMHLYFMARGGAHKYKNLEENSPVCLVVCSEKFASSVEVKGNAYKVEDGNHANNLLAQLAHAIKRKNPGPLPILHFPGSEIFLFRMEPKSLTYADFYTPSSSEGEFFEVHI